ncbi:elongation factor G [Candidatus Poribacteria bacterium]
MKQYRTDQIKNIAVVSHAGAGKTSLTEALLYNAGAINELGRVDKGTTVSDYNEDEIQRTNSIVSSLCVCEWNGSKINLIDTPGYSDFIGEQVAAIRVVDNLLIVVDGTVGVEAGTERAWYRAEDSNKPRVVFINKLDREMAKFDETIQSLESLGGRMVPIHVPIGLGTDFRGVVDLIKMKAFIGSDGGKKLEESDIPDEVQEQVQQYRESLIDAVAETDDDLLEKYLEGEELTDEQILNGLKLGIAGNQFVPVMCGSAYNNIGPQLVLDMAAELPSPVDVEPVSVDETTIEADADGPLCAFVFKTMTDPYAGRVNYFRVYSGTMKTNSHVQNSTKDDDERIANLSSIHGKTYTSVDQVIAGDFGAVMKLTETATSDTLCDPDNEIVLPPIDFPKPVISMAVLPRTQGDDEKLGTMMIRMAGEDPTFIIRRDAEIKQTIISGMGELHINVILDKIQKRFSVGAETSEPKVPYRETIRSTSEQQGRYKKQTGGRGQYADSWIRMEPQPRGEGFEFVDAIKGGSIPGQYIPAVEKGLIEAMEEGVLAGSPVVDMKITLYDGGFHPVDSSEMAFKIAASMAFKKAMAACSPFIMEPIADVEVTVPDEYMGDIMSDLNSRRGRIAGMTPQGNRQVIKAQVPVSEMGRYSVDLRSITSDRGTFSMEFSHYEEVPFDVSEKIVAEYNSDDE